MCIYVHICLPYMRIYVHICHIYARHICTYMRKSHSPTMQLLQANACDWLGITFQAAHWLLIQKTGRGHGKEDKVCFPLQQLAGRQQLSH